MLSDWIGLKVHVLFPRLLADSVAKAEQTPRLGHCDISLSKSITCGRVSAGCRKSIGTF